MQKKNMVLKLRVDTLKGILAGAIALSSIGLFAADVTGKVFEDKNKNGKQDAGEPGIAKMILTDGYHFTTSKADGSYSLERSPKGKFVMIHQPGNYRTDTWYFLIQKDDAPRDFAMLPAKVKSKVRFIHTSDGESNDFPYLPAMKKYCQNNDIDFISNTGDLCRADGIRNHARFFTTQTMGLPVYYSVGNHDLEAPDRDGTRYDDHLGPYWFSFEEGGILFVSVPMSSGNQYKLDDFYAYLTKLMAMFPKDKPKVMFCHDLLFGDNEMTIPGSAKIKLSDWNLRGWFYGHWHYHLPQKYPNPNMKAFSTGPVNKGGIDHSPAAFRMTEIDKTGKLHTEMIWAGIDSTLTLSGIDDENTVINSNGDIPLSAVAYSSVSSVKSVMMRIQGANPDEATAIPLKKVNPMTWQTTWRPDASLAGQICIASLTANFEDGRSLNREITFTIPDGAPAVSPVKETWGMLLGNAAHTGGYLPDCTINTLAARWIQPMKSENIMSSPVVGNGRVFVGASDDANGENGGIYAFDAENGKPAWFFKTGYTVRGSIAYSDGKIFANDIIGNVYALSEKDGKVIWKADAIGNGLPTTPTGLVTDGKTVWAGARRGLRAFEAVTGKVIWTNSAHNHGEGTVNTLTVADGKLYTGANWRGFYAHDANTGKLLWTLNNGDQRFQNATVTAEGAYAYVKGKSILYQVNAQDGKIAQQIDLKSIESAAAPVIAGDLILCVTDQDGIIAIHKKTFQKAWQFKENKTAIIDTLPYQTKVPHFEGSPVVTGKTIWIGAADGYLYGINLANGTLKQKINIGSPILTTPAVAGDNLFISDFAGRLFRFQKKS